MLLVVKWRSHLVMAQIPGMVEVEQSQSKVELVWGIMGATLPFLLATALDLLMEDP
jgi:hypothetical protein